MSRTGRASLAESDRASGSDLDQVAGVPPVLAPPVLAPAAWPPAVWPVSHQRTFPGSPDAVGRARGFLAGVLAGSPVADAAELVVGELGANAVLHSRSRLPGGVFVVRTEIAADRVRLEVTDLGGPWVRSAGGAAADEHGRGLEIVSQLASLWGVATGPRGRTVWCEFALSRRH